MFDSEQENDDDAEWPAPDILEKGTMSGERAALKKVS